MKKVKSEEYSQQYFLNDCEGWDQWRQSPGQLLSPRLSYALNLLPVKKGAKVLDFGCGRGDASLWLARRAAEVWAVDYSSAALNLLKQGKKKLSKKEAGNIKLIKSDVEELNLKDNSFDLIYFLDVWEHLTKKEVDLVLSKFFNSLKPGGKLIVHTAPNKLFLNWGYPFFTRWLNFLALPFWRFFFKEGRIVARDLRSDYDKRVHINEQTRGSVTEQLKKTGFKVRAWTDNRFHLIRIRDKLDYWFLRPIWLPGLKEIFSWDIWAIGERPQ